MIHEVWALDNTVYRKCQMALNIHADNVFVFTSTSNCLNVKYKRNNTNFIVPENALTTKINPILIKVKPYLHSLGSMSVARRQQFDVFRCWWIILDDIINIGFLGQIRQMSSQFKFHAFELKLFCFSSCTAFKIQNSAIQFRFGSSQIP